MGVALRTMKTSGPALVTLLAGLGLGLASSQFSGEPCRYSCTEGGGCEVHYIGPPRRGKTQGSCFPDSFGGSCSGTPRECQDCNRAITCREDIRTPTRIPDSGFQLIPAPTRTPTRTCRCNGHFNANGDGECGTKFNGGHFCYINPGDCSDGVRSAKTGLWWSYQACNRAPPPPPRTRQPRILVQSSLVEQVPGGQCITTCNNWPHSQCKIEFRFGNGGRQAATCITPQFSNYPECASVPAECQRCDETCSIRDGRSVDSTTETKSNCKAARCVLNNKPDF